MRASIDLSPWFGRITADHAVRLEKPGPEALEECLARLEEDADWSAADEIKAFAGDAERIVPVLIRLLDDDECRGPALLALGGFAAGAGAHADRIVRIALRGAPWERVIAIGILGDGAPDTPFVRKVLGAAAGGDDEEVARAARSALERLDAR